DRVAVDAGGGELLVRLLSGLLLVLVVIEDDRAVLRAVVGPLGVERRRVVALPEDLEQVVVGDFRGVVFDLDDLGVPGQPGADHVVGRVRGVAPGVARDDVLDAGDAFEDRFEAPEAAAAEGRQLGLGLGGVGHRFLLGRFGLRRTALGLAGFGRFALGRT